jgi:DNA polymerase (family 10)
MKRVEATYLIGEVSKFVRPWDFHIAGSYRRMKDEVGDIDIISLGPSDEINKRVQDAAKEGQVEVLEIGPQKVSFTWKDHGILYGEQVDIRYTDRAHLGSMLCYFTGSRDFNIRLRSYAKQKGFKLTEYGLRLIGSTAGGAEPPLQTFEDEKGLFAALGLVYTAPFLRNGRGVMRKVKR